MCAISDNFSKPPNKRMQSDVAYGHAADARRYMNI